MTDKVNEKRKTKYYLVDGILYELAVNFELMTMNIEEVNIFKKEFLDSYKLTLDELQ